MEGGCFFIFKLCCSFFGNSYGKLDLEYKKESGNEL